MIEFEEDGEMTVVWAGSHDDYEKTFKNNRNVIKKWLRDNEWI
jgi:mRNA interferase HigB